MVGDTGIEPVTPSMSTKCSTAELITQYFASKGRPKPFFKQTDAGKPAPVRLSIRGVGASCKGVLHSLVFRL